MTVVQEDQGVKLLGGTQLQKRKPGNWVVASGSVLGWGAAWMFERIRTGKKMKQLKSFKQGITVGTPIRHLTPFRGIMEQSVQPLSVLIMNVGGAAGRGVASNNHEKMSPQRVFHYRRTGSSRLK